MLSMDPNDMFCDRNAGIRSLLIDCVVDRKDTIDDVLVTYLKKENKEYKVVSTGGNGIDSLRIGANYDLIIEILKSTDIPIMGIIPQNYQYYQCFKFGKKATSICLSDTLDSTHVVSHNHLYKFVRLGNDTTTNKESDPRIRHKGERILNTSHDCFDVLGVRYLTDVVIKNIPTLSKCDIQVTSDYSLPFDDSPAIYNRMRDSYERLYGLYLPRITKKDCPFYLNGFSEKPFYETNGRIVAFSYDWEKRKNRGELTVYTCIRYMNNMNLCFKLTDFPQNEIYSGVVIMDLKGNLIDYYISEEDVFIPIESEFYYKVKKSRRKISFELIH